MTELDNMPLYEIQTLYYQFWKEKLAESEMPEDKKAGLEFSRMIEDEIN